MSGYTRAVSEDAPTVEIPRDEIPAAPSEWEGRLCDALFAVRAAGHLTLDGVHVILGIMGLSSRPSAAETKGRAA